MVMTVRPKASETPRRPIPTPGKAAARTALPHPPKTSQKVPMNSAAQRFEIGTETLLHLNGRCPAEAHATTTGGHRYDRQKRETSASPTYPSSYLPVDPLIGSTGRREDRKAREAESWRYVARGV